MCSSTSVHELYGDGKTDRHKLTVSVRDREREKRKSKGSENVKPVSFICHIAVFFGSVFTLSTCVKTTSLVVLQYNPL